MERQRSIRRRRRNEKSFAKKFKECVRNFVAFMFSNVGIIGLVIGYAIAGAFIFIKIEEGSFLPYNISIAYNMSRYRNETAWRLWNLTVSMNVFNQTAWREMVKRELRVYQKTTTIAIKEKGYDGTNRVTNMWSISGAFLYSLTVITTIGYGNIVPKSDWGKVTTIIYAIIGMPLFLLYLSNIGDIMARSFKWLYATCCLCKGCPGVSQRRAERKRQKLEQLQLDMLDHVGSDLSDDSWQRNGRGDSSLDGYNPEDEEDYVANGGGGGGGSLTTDPMSEESFDSQTVTVPVSICLTIMVGYIFSGAWLFSHYEDWGLLDASYFCFISLSTIGFGDIVPGEKIYSSEGFDFEISFVLCSMYLMLGMALIAMCFNLMQEEVIHKFRSAVSTLKYCLRCGR